MTPATDVAGQLNAAVSQNPRFHVTGMQGFVAQIPS